MIGTGDISCPFLFLYDRKEAGELDAADILLFHAGSGPRGHAPMDRYLAGAARYLSAEASYE